MRPSSRNSQQGLLSAQHIYGSIVASKCARCMQSMGSACDCRACTTKPAEVTLEPAVLQELQRWNIDAKTAGSAHFACLAPAATYSVEAVCCSQV